MLLFVFFWSMILQQDLPLLAQNPLGGGLRALERRVEELRDHANALCRNREMEEMVKSRLMV
ncbi:hypothetical protein Hanom_Chr11g01041601 [Helianthus anomalus]